MSKPVTGQEVIQAFEKLSPKKYALEGDKIGLQIGTLNKRVRRIMVTLDVLEDVVDEAIAQQVDMIIAHHPLLYRPLKKIPTDEPYGRIVQKCLKHDITVYAAHTNLDVAPGGVNDLMAEALGLKDTEVLVPTTEVALKKLVVFVPKDHLIHVREAISKAGAGHIGNYSHCTFNTEGVGTFLPEEGTNPYIGESGKMEYVEEVKLETIMTEAIEKKVISAMIKAHPYEEPAYDVYPLENKGETLGLGRIGVLPAEMTLEQFAEHVKKAFDVKGVRVVGPLESKIRKVAVLGGDGNKYTSHARMRGADVYVTGDMYYHVAHDAMMEGLHIVDPGHNVEKVMKKAVKEYLENYLHDKKYETDVIVSDIHTDPFTFR